MLGRYFLKRLLLTLPLLLGISLLIFGVIHLAPGNPVQAESAMNSKMSVDSVKALRELYGMDQPLATQYWNWLKRLASLDLGRSFRDQRPVIDKIIEALPATLLLNVGAMILMLGIGIPLGVFGAARQGSRVEKGLGLFSFVAWSLPAFVVALLAQWILGLNLGWLPISGYRSMAYSGGFLSQAWDIALHLALPLLATTFGAWAVISRYVRSSMIEALSQDHVRTAYAKGLGEQAVLRRHALPLSLMPLITMLGMSLPGLLGGSVIIESIFAWPGMGRLMWEAATGYDYPVVMGVSFIGAALTLFGNLIADLAYAWVDPRVRY